MKKLFALLLTLVLLCSAALAETTVIPGTSLKLDLTGLFLLELDEEDLADDMVLCFINDEYSLDCYIWVTPADGYTLADMADELAEDETGISCGYTTINGIETYFWVGQAEEGTLVEYYVIDGESLVQISFDCLDDAAAQLSGQIMNTLTK